MRQIGSRIIGLCSLSQPWLIILCLYSAITMEDLARIAGEPLKVTRSQIGRGTLLRIRPDRVSALSLPGRMQWKEKQIWQNQGDIKSVAQK